MTRGDRLGHSWREGQLKFPGLASDFAAMIRAALALYEATGEQSIISIRRSPGSTRSIATTPTRETGTYYLTAADAEGLVIRPASTADEATPNHNAVAAQNLVRLALLAGDDWWREKADRLIAGDRAARGRKSLHAHGAVQRRRSAAARRRDCRNRGGRRRRCFAGRRARKMPPLDRVILHARSADALPSAHPARAQIEAARGQAQAFVCVGETCSLPVTDEAGLFGALTSVRHN